MTAGCQILVGAAVVVDASTLLRVLLHAGLPCRDVAYGGADCGKAFLLDDHDRLTKYVEVEVSA